MDNKNQKNQDAPKAVQSKQPPTENDTKNPAIKMNETDQPSNKN